MSYRTCPECGGRGTKGWGAYPPATEPCPRCGGKGWIYKTSERMKEASKE